MKTAHRKASEKAALNTSVVLRAKRISKVVKIDPVLLNAKKPINSYEREEGSMRKFRKEIEEEKYKYQAVTRMETMEENSFICGFVFKFFSLFILLIALLIPSVSPWGKC